ncbi:hypothetical protein U1Q18_027775, partial [Sarracenia purpurea var. burkii]
ECEASRIRDQTEERRGEERTEEERTDPCQCHHPRPLAPPATETMGGGEMRDTQSSF